LVPDDQPYHQSSSAASAGYSSAGYSKASAICLLMSFSILVSYGMSHLLRPSCSPPRLKER
jgi:hypothetical protein